MLRCRTLIRVPLPRYPAPAGATRLRRAGRRAATCASAEVAPEPGSKPLEVHIRCKDCGGTGSLSAGGYHRKNPLNASKLIGSKWTARERVLGWRHFSVREKRRTSVAVYALLVATCDPDAQLWINVQNLRDRGLWACGWLQTSELQALDEAARPCKTCGGSGRLQGYMSL